MVCDVKSIGFSAKLAAVRKVIENKCCVTEICFNGTLLDWNQIEV